MVPMGGAAMWSLVRGRPHVVAGPAPVAGRSVLGLGGWVALPQSLSEQLLADRTSR